MKNSSQSPDNCIKLESNSAMVVPVYCKATQETVFVSLTWACVDKVKAYDNQKRDFLLVGFFCHRPLIDFIQFMGHLAR